MSEYHHSGHAVWDIKYHLVWITKYRYKVLRGEVAERARDLLREICAAGSADCAGGGVAGPHPHAGGGASAVGAGEAGAVPEGAVVPDVAAGLPIPAQAVLGGLEPALSRSRFRRLPAASRLSVGKGVYRL